MQNTLTLPSTLKPEEARPTFNVVIVYEDLETGKYAKKIYDFLAENLGEECEFSNQMWKFGVLAISKLREMAAKDAAAADIIIIAAHGGQELPDEVKCWIELWMEEKSNALALVGLFDADQSVENPASAYLARIAQRVGMEFFSQPGLWPGTEEIDLRGVGDQSSKTFSLLAGLVRRDEGCSHWGINE